MPGITLGNPGIMLANGAGIHARYSQYFRAYMLIMCKLYPGIHPIYQYSNSVAESIASFMASGPRHTLAWARLGDLARFESELGVNATPESRAQALDYLNRRVYELEEMQRRQPTASVPTNQAA